MSITPELQTKLEQLAQKALSKWGTQAQIDMMIEESLEAALEFHRDKRGRTTNEKMLEEAVDCYIMANQMALIFGHDKFNSILAYKLDRLEFRLYNISIDAKMENYENDDGC